MSGIDIQDFNTVVIGKKGSKGVGGGSNGHPGDKKGGFGVVGLGGKLESGAAAKLDSDEAKAPDTVGPKVGQAIQKARLAKGLKQTDLAKALNKTDSVIQQLESGKHKKDNATLQMLEKKLGVWLTGDIEKLGQPKTKESKGKKSKVVTALKKVAKDKKMVDTEDKEEDIKLEEDARV